MRAPLFERRLYQSGDTLDRAAFRLWQLEAELMFSFRVGLPPIGRSYSRDEVVAAVDSVIVGFEIVESRFSSWPKVDAPLLLADLLSHGAIVVGSGTPLRTRIAFERLPFIFAVDGRRIVSCKGGNPAGDIIELLVWLANDLPTSGHELHAGDLVTTGSYTGMQFLRPGGRAEARVPGIGSVEIIRRA